MRLKQLLFDPGASCRDAGINHLAQGGGFIPVSHPAEAGMVYVAFLPTGPGRRRPGYRPNRKNSTF